MNSKIAQKILRLKPWHVLFLAIVFSEIFTAVLNTIMGVIWWGEISFDLLQIGMIDAFIVSLIVAIFVIYSVRVSTKLLAEKEFLEQEVIERKQAEEALRESREKYYQLFENESDALMIFDALTLQFEDANQATLDLYGYTKEEFLALKVTDISAEEEKTRASVQGVIEGTPGSNRVPMRYMRKKDGTVFAVEISAGSFFSKGRKKLIGAVRDITERRRAEEALAREKEFTENALNTLQDLFFVHDMEGRMLRWNKRMNEVTGYSDEEISSMKATDFVPAEEVPPTLDAIERIVKDGFVSNETTIVTRDGKRISYELTGSLLRDREGNFVGICGTGRDITERRRAEEALLIKESAIASSINAIAISDLEGRVTYVNASCLNLWGYDSEKGVLGRSAVEFWQERGKAEEALEAVRRNGSYIGELAARRRDGSLFDAQISATLVMGAAGAPICMMASFVDVTERKRAEEALRESREKYYQLFENESDAVTIFDVETLRIEDANRAALDMYGYTKEEFLALKITDLSAEEEKTRLGVQRIMKGEPGSNRVPLRYMKRKDGTVFPAEIGSGIFFSGERKKLIGAVRDVTERIHAEEEKRKLAQLYYHSQKLEALGALAGGIAHDVNNLMGIILSNMELARMKAQENISPYLDRAISAVERGKGIVRNLMNFPHGTPSAQGPVDLGAVTRETIRLLEKDTDEGIAVKVNAQPGLRPVGGNPAELQQMVLNLFLNARDAVASRAFGGNDRDSFIHFTLDNVSIPEAHLPENMRHPTGDFVRLTVTDNGCGMDKETVSRIFEPYFTTKGEGGSGLGLSTVWSIVKQCNGWIDVKSTPEEGTEFQIYLPWWKEEIPAEGLPLSRGQVGGAETVLIVDDEQHIANASREMLEQLGYNVLVAYSAGEALNIYREKHDSIDLVFSDIVMPDRSGIKLLAAIKEIDPDVKVVLTSGKELISCGNSTELQGISFLAKPYSLNEFAGRVRSMLGDRKAAKTMKDHLNKINFYYVKEKTFPYDERVISSDILYNIFRDRLSSDVKERFIVVLLDSEKRIIAYEEVGSGTVGEAFVYIREVIRSAIITNAHSIVLIHNHTSGVPKPSLEDIRLTLEISRACSIHNIKLLDHLIIGGDGYCSFSKRGLL